jgi:hypothetical protein
LASKNFPEAIKVLIIDKVTELCKAPIVAPTHTLMSAEQMAEAAGCINTSQALPAKFWGAREDLIIEDPVHAAFGLEDFMNVRKDEEWYAKMVEGKQEICIQKEVQQLVADMRVAVGTCTTNGQETEAFTGHLHYLTMIEELKGSLRAVGRVHVVLDVDKVHAGIGSLGLELMDFLDYVLKNKVGGTKSKDKVRDQGRADASLDYFARHPNSVQAKLRYIMAVFFFLEKKISSSNSGAKAHRFGLCSQRSVSI